jgi:hypothetical protein
MYGYIYMYIYMYAEKVNLNNKNKDQKNVDLSNTDKTVYCDEYVDHPVLINQRDTFANFFHDSEDFFNVFLASAILGLVFLYFFTNEMFWLFIVGLFCLFFIICMLTLLCLWLVCIFL